jgi:N-methylhydantoinase A
MESEALAWLDRESVAPARRRLVRALDMRYLGQNFELTVPAPSSDLGRLRHAFLREHERVYGYAAEDEAVQVVAFRLTGLGEPEPLGRPSVGRAARPEPVEAGVGERAVYFEEARAFVPTPIYRRERLLAGHRLAGPAVVEQMDSTTVILPGQSADVDEQGNLLITTSATEARR